MTTFTPNPFPGFQGFKPQPNNPSTTKTVSVTKGPKAGKNGTLVSMLVDESGSMGPYVQATIEGYNEFLSGQEKDGDLTYISLIKFENGEVKKPYTKVHVKAAPRLTTDLYKPGGMTNLLDAIGQTITDVDALLNGMPENERPAVIIVIQTDGHENASREYTYETIRALVKDREENDWAFMFLGANIDAFATGAQFGMNAYNTASYTMNNQAGVYSTISATVSRTKSLRSMGASTEAVYAQAMFTDEERKDMTKGGK
jgi:Mg-chelatase subunit ChlD